MTLDLQDPRAEAANDPGPDAGVIEEARRRHRARRRSVALAIPLVALVAGILAAILSGGPSRAHRHAGRRDPRSARLAHAGSPPPLRSARIAPALTGGSYGWSLITDGGGSCCTVPVRGVPLAGETTVDTRRGYETASFLAGPELAAIALDGHRLRTEFVALPFGLRLARATIRHPSHGLSFWPGPGRTLTALGRDGQALPRFTPARGPAVASRWWQRPNAAAAGPCALRAHGLPGLSARWGHVASALLPYGQPISGRAFFSCIDTEYFLRGWPMDAAILLDAQHPGSPPAPLPEMRPLAGAPGFFALPGTWQGAITAERFPRWWLVLAGGSGPAQRLEVLRHLRASVSPPGRERS